MTNPDKPGVYRCTWTNRHGEVREYFNEWTGHEWMYGSTHLGDHVIPVGRRGGPVSAYWKLQEWKEVDQC